MKTVRPYPACTVTKKAEAAILGGHPWVYADEITAPPLPAPANGALVDVLSAKGRYLGTGFLSEASKIRVRLLSRSPNDRFDAASGAAGQSTPGPTAKPCWPPRTSVPAG